VVLLEIEQCQGFARPQHTTHGKGATVADEVVRQVERGQWGSGSSERIGQGDASLVADLIVGQTQITQCNGILQIVGQEFGRILADLTLGQSK